MPHTSSSSALAREELDVVTMARQRGRTTRLLAADDRLPRSCTQPLERHSWRRDRNTPLVCSAPSLSGHYGTERACSDEEVAAATPTRQTGPSVLRTTPNSAFSSNERDDDAASTVSSRQCRAVDEQLPLTSSSALRRGSFVTEDISRTTSSGSPHMTKRMSGEGSTSVNVDLTHPIVSFLSSVQLQGFADHLIETHALHTLDDLTTLAKTEEAAGSLLGDLASRQQRSDFWKGLQRASREAVRSKQRAAKEAQKRKRAAHTTVKRASRMSTADTDSARVVPETRVFALDSLCDELLALPSVSASTRTPQRAMPVSSRAAVSMPCNACDTDASEVSPARTVSASQLLRALTLSGDDIAALRARRHTKTQTPRANRTGHPSTSSLAPVDVVDVDAEESVSDEMEDSEEEQEEGEAQGEHDVTDKRNHFNDGLRQLADSRCSQSSSLTAVPSPSLSEVLSSLATEKCEDAIGCLARPAQESSDTSASVPVLHHTNESISLCGLYRRSESLARCVTQASQPGKELTRSADVADSDTTHTDHAEEQEEPTRDSPPRVSPLRSDADAMERRALALREELEQSVSHLVSQYNVALEALRQEAPDKASETICPTSVWQPLTVVLVPSHGQVNCSVSRDGPRASHSQSETAADPLLDLARAAHTTSTLSVSGLPSHRSSSVVYATAPATRRTLWAAQTNNQWGCHGASDEEDDANVCVTQQLSDEEAPGTICFVPSIPPPPPPRTSGSDNAHTPCSGASRSVSAENTASLAPTQVDAERSCSPVPQQPFSSPSQCNRIRELASPARDASVPSEDQHGNNEGISTRTSDDFWETFGLDALDGTAVAERDLLCATRTSTSPPAETVVQAASCARSPDTVPIDVDEESVSHRSSAHGQAVPVVTNEVTLRPELDVARRPTGDQEDAIRWLLANGLTSSVLDSLSLDELRQRCQWLGLRVGQAADMSNRSVAVSGGDADADASRQTADRVSSVSEPSAISFDRFGLDSLNETATMVATQLNLENDHTGSAYLLGGDARSRSRSPTPRPVGEDASCSLAAAELEASHTHNAAPSFPDPANGSEDAGSLRRCRKRRRREMEGLEADALREQIRLAAVQARFQRIVCPAVLHRLPSFSGLPYHRVTASHLSSFLSASVAGEPELTDVTLLPDSLKMEETKETWRCVLAALTGNAAAALEDDAEHAMAPLELPTPASPSAPTAGKPRLSLMDTLLLLEPLNCNEVAAVVQREFPHIAVTRVRQMIVDSGVSLGCSVQTDGGGVATSRASAERAATPSPDALTPRSPSASPGVGAASPEETRRANARSYFATRGMPVRGGRHNVWRARGRGRGRGRGGRGA